MYQLFSHSKILYFAQIAFKCIVRISEQTVTFTLYISSFFISEVENVYNAVRTESLYKIHHVSYLKCIRTFPRPATTTHVFLVFLYLQANTEMAPKIPSCYCVLLMKPSQLKFTKINPLTLQ